METKRQLDVLDQQLKDQEFIIGNTYSIADMAIWPWYGVLVQGKLYGAAEFLSVDSYRNVQRWTQQIYERRAVKRGRIVNKTWGKIGQQVRERHEAKDISEKLY